MIADLPTNVDEFREFIAREMHERTSAGDTTTAAADAVLDVIRTRGLTDLYLEMIGHAPIIAWFLGVNREMRGLPPIDMTPSKRRIGGVLNPEGSILEGCWPVGNKWIKLGDMDLSHLETQESYFGKEASGRLAKQTFFGALKKPLKKGDRVRDRWTEEGVTAIYPRAG